MPLMDAAGTGQDGRGNNLYSQIHWHNSERSSGAKTPKTPNLRESALNYNDMYLSGRCHRERTPSVKSVKSGSGEKTPTICEHRSVRSGRSSGDKTLKENERWSPLCQPSAKIAEMVPVESPNKRERPSQGKRMCDRDEDDIYNHTLSGSAHQGSGYFAPSRQKPVEGSDKREVNRRDTWLPHDKTSYSRHFELKGHCKIRNEGITEDDSGYSVFRGCWNSSPCSQVSVMEEFVQAQAEGLGHYSDLKKMSNDEWRTNFKKSKIRSCTKQKAVAAVLAFQRWRHTQLKKLFSVELKHLLERAKEDEARLATLEKELAIKDKHMAQLRLQLTQYEKASQGQMNQRQMHESLGANVSVL